MSLDGNERSVWITLLCLASQTNGVVRFMTEPQIIERAGVKNGAKYAGVLDKFQERGMITISNGNVTVLNWAKRQYSEGYLRVKTYRETLLKRKRNGNVTPYTDTDTDTDTDTENTKGKNLVFVQSLFKGFNDLKIEIQSAAEERQKYPSLFRRKNPDVNYWLKVAAFSQSYGFKSKTDWVSPWKGPVKLSKLYYEIRAKYDEGIQGVAGKKTYADMKSKAEIKTMA